MACCSRSERGFQNAPPMNPDRRFVAAGNQLDDVVDHAFRGILWTAVRKTRRAGTAGASSISGGASSAPCKMIELLRVGVATRPIRRRVSPMCWCRWPTARPHAVAVFDVHSHALRARALLTDEGYPRSVAFQLAALLDRVEGLPQAAADDRQIPERVLQQNGCAAWWRGRRSTS